MTSREQSDHYRYKARKNLFLIIFIVSVFFIHQCSSIRWLAIANGKEKYWNKTRHCSKNRRENGLVKSQVRLCKKHLELMPVVAQATKETMRVCKKLFAERRWNCSSISFAPHFKADLVGGSREQAFVYALTAATLTQSIAKACSLGASSKCSCGHVPNTAPPDEFKWGGCGDDLRYGMTFSRSFADGVYLRRKKQNKKSLINLHNYKAGRKIIERSLTKACKCHGVSGSCSIKTCWKALADMTTVGTILQQKYAVAIEVRRKRAKNRQKLFVPVRGRRNSNLLDDALIYYRKSPDYCLPDEKMGSLGTHGRQCKKDDPGAIGCQSMCCGRGYTSRSVQVKHRCNCKYYWCCYVKCDTCTKKVTIHRCR